MWLASELQLVYIWAPIVTSWTTMGRQLAFFALSSEVLITCFRALVRYSHFVALFRDPDLHTSEFMDLVSSETSLFCFDFDTNWRPHMTIFRPNHHSGL